MIFKHNGRIFNPAGEAVMGAFNSAVKAVPVQSKSPPMDPPTMVA